MSRHYLIAVLCLAFVQICALVAAHKAVHLRDDNDTSPVVETSGGLVRGKRSYTADQKKPYYVFKGIPFAEPPIGPLRFAPPVPSKKWNGTLDAFQDPKQCTQGVNPVQGSEDCLYLRVFTRSVANRNRTRIPLSPVMVFIHGGAFNQGNSTWYGPDYFLDEGVVYVSANYRLGIFGFLSTGDLVVPGNNGLKDQALFLKWVRQNVDAFGGDPNKVTIFGESAGAVSVSYHLQSKLSKDLFQGAIMESGTSLCPWSLSRFAKKFANTVGTLLNLNTTSSESLVNSMRTLNYTELQAGSQIVNDLFVLNYPSRGIPLGPVKEPEHEGAFYTGLSQDDLSKGQFYHVPTIIGFNSLEASSLIGLAPQTFAYLYLLNNNNLVPVDMKVNPANVSDVAYRIHLLYWGYGPVALGSDTTTRFFSDDMFDRPIRETVALQSKYAPVYFYEFDYRGLLGGSSGNVSGVGHSQELHYLFTFPSNNNSTEKDRLTRSRMVKLWTNFARFGNPTPVPDELFQNVTWPTARQRTGYGLTYLSINNTGLEVDRNPLEKYLHYWNDLYHDFGNPPFDTY